MQSASRQYRVNEVRTSVSLVPSWWFALLGMGPMVAGVVDNDGGSHGGAM